MLNKKRFLQCTRTFFIGQTGFGPPAPPSLALLARFKSWRMLAHSIVKKNPLCLKQWILKNYFSGKQDLNLRPQRPERRALPAALLPVKKNCPNLFSRRMRPQRPELENRRTVKKNCEDLEQFFRFYLQATRYQLRKFSKKTWKDSLLSKQLPVKKIVRNCSVARCDCNVPNM